MIVNICRFIIVNYSQTDRQNKLTCSFIIKELHHIFKCSFHIFFIMKLSSECNVVLNRSDFLLFFSLFSFFIDTMYEQSLKGLCQLGHMRSRVRSSLICIQLIPGVLLFRHFIRRVVRSYSRAERRFRLPVF